MADLTAGSIAFTGFNADGNDNLAFVALQDIPAGTVITFTDNAWSISAFASGESVWTWTAGSDITAGTVVTMDGLAAGQTATSNLGAISYLTEGARGLDTGSEVVYAYTGDASAPTFLTAIANGAINNVAGNLNGTGLTAGVDALGFLSGNDFDIAAYDGPRATGETLDNLRTFVFDRTRWATQNTAGDDSSDGVGPDAPFSTTPFTVDPDAQRVFFSADSLTVTHAEGNSGTTTYTFVVERSNGTTGAVNFAGTFSRGNTVASDYPGSTLPLTAFSGTIPEGATSATVTVTIAADMTYEPLAEENFSLTLKSATNTAATAYVDVDAADNKATGIILNDDTQQLIGFAANSTNVMVVEGDEGTRTISFTVERTGTGGNVGDVAFSGTFAAGDVNAADFGGVLPTGFSGIIRDGESSATVTLTYSGDTTPEGNNFFNLILNSATNPAAQNVALGTRGAQGIILNDDGPAVVHAGETFDLMGITGQASLTIEQGGAVKAIGIAGKDFDVTINNAGRFGFDGAGMSYPNGNGRITFNNLATGTIAGLTPQKYADANSLEFIFNNEGQAGPFNASQNTTYASITIDNRAGGMISNGTSNANAIGLIHNATITNAGRIITTAGGREGIEYSGTNVVVTNLAGGWIEGAHHAVTGKGTVLVTNEAGGTMIGRNGSAVNIDNTFAGGHIATVINRGLMQGQSLNTIDSDGDAIDTDGPAVIENWGTIEGLGHSGSHNGGLNVSEGIAIGGGSITNYAGGLIAGYGRGIQVDNSSEGGAFTAVTIVNDGTIRGNGNLPMRYRGSNPLFEVATEYAPIMNGGEAINIVGEWADSLTNTGEIIGGVRMGGGDDVVVNRGRITATGGSALDLGAGNDTLNAYAGSLVLGLTNGGDGNDTINLFEAAGSSQAGVFGQIANVETVNVMSGNWTLMNGAGSAGVKVESGSLLSLSSGTTSSGAIVIDGAVYNYGTTTAATVRSGGALHVYDGGNSSNTVVEAGGYQDVWNGSTATGTSLSGSQQILAGGSAIDTSVLSGGYQYVGSGGETGGSVIQSGGFQYVDVGGTANGTIVRGGDQIVMGNSTGGSSGGSTSNYGLSISAIIENGGAQHVYDGGQAFNARIDAGGFQDVADATVTGTRLTGNQQVLAGGSAVTTTILSGGYQYVGAGGSASNSVVNAGGLQYVASGGSADHSSVRGGYLFAGGSVTDARIDNGGQLEVAGTAVDTDLVRGSAHVHAGGVQNGVDFGGGASGVLYLDNASGLTGTVSNFEAGDAIDIANLDVTAFDFDGTTLTLATAGGTIAWQFSGLAADAAFNVTSDGHGGTAIVLLTQYAASFAPAGFADSVLAPQQDSTSMLPTLANAA